MNIHEYQAKEIFSRFGIPIPKQYVISSLDEVEDALEVLEGPLVVLKVQVHAGGRGKAGGVKLARDAQEVRQLARDLLGMKVINAQTGSQGVVAHKLMLSEGVDIKKEYYVSLTIDRKEAQISLILSFEGGVDIEEVAQKTPEAILTIPVTNDGRIRNFHLVRACKFMGWSADVAKQAKSVLRNLAKVFVQTDASLVEVNPLVLDKNEHIIALDAKISVDDNALFRQPLLQDLFDPTQLPDNEVQALQHNLSYVALDGDIGCMVNGAGLAMATMDLIYTEGGKPANFLDVGGSASEEKVAEGFKIILADKGVRAILVNIFGGIMNCATIASGLVSAAREVEISIPLVVRMEGNNVERGKEIIEEAKLNIILANDLTDAAKKVVEHAYAKR